jgi:hypothetical protein
LLHSSKKLAKPTNNNQQQSFYVHSNNDTNQQHHIGIPTTTITPIIDSHSRTSYASLGVTQTELNGNNAALVHSNLGDGLHGHLA